MNRQGWVDAGISGAESVADHSFGVGMMAMLLSDEIGLDTLRVLQMALLHDVAESITGDIIPGTITATQKKRQEHEAMCILLELLPITLRDRYAAVWREYTKHESPEAILVRDADRLDMALQAARYNNRMDPSTLESFYRSAKQGISGRGAASILRQAGL